MRVRVCGDRVTVMWLIEALETVASCGAEGGAVVDRVFEDGRGTMRASWRMGA